MVIIKYFNKLINHLILLYGVVHTSVFLVRNYHEELDKLDAKAGKIILGLIIIG
jgi:hypothetical protein